MDQSWMQKAFWWLVDNLPPISLMVFGAYAIYMAEAGQWNTDKVLVAVLAVLELIALSEFVERHRQIAAIEKGVKQVKDSQAVRGVWAIYEDRTQLPPLLHDIAGCKEEILVVGLAAVNLTLTFLDALRERAEHGCRLRILLINPGSNDAPNPVIENLSATLGFEAQQYASMIRGSLDRLTGMKESLPKRMQGRVEIKVYLCVPTLVFFGFDANTPGGKIRVDLIPFQVSRSLWPSWELRYESSSKLYNFFYESANKMWSLANEWAPSAKGAQH